MPSSVLETLRVAINVLHVVYTFQLPKQEITKYSQIKGYLLNCSHVYPKKTDIKKQENYSDSVNLDVSSLIQQHCWMPSICQKLW